MTEEATPSPPATATEAPEATATEPEFPPDYPDRRVDREGISQRIAARRGLPSRKYTSPVTYEYDKRVWVFHGAFFILGFVVAWVLEALTRH